MEIEYDALGRRIETHDYTGVSDPWAEEPTMVATRHIYAGLEVIEERGGAGVSARDACSGEPMCDPGGEWVLAREFLWGERFPEPLVMVDWTAAGDVAAGSEEVLHYVRDAHGSVIGLTDAGDPEATPDPIPGKLVERYVYDPYGRTVVEVWDENTSAFVRNEVTDADGLDRFTSKYGNPWMWTGQRNDTGVGLYAFPYRTYSPELGRWLQRDPLGYVDGVNLYEYVRSRATRFVDPFGLDDRDPQKDYDDAILRRQGHAEQAEILITGTAAAVYVAAEGLGNTMTAAAVILLPGPEDAVISVALGTKIGTRVIRLLADVLKKKKVEKAAKLGKKSANILSAEKGAKIADDFEKLSEGAVKIENKGGGVKVATHEDGTKVIMRSSKDGRGTIEIQPPDGPKTKVRYGEKENPEPCDSSGSGGDSDSSGSSGDKGEDASGSGAEKPEASDGDSGDGG